VIAQVAGWARPLVAASAIVAIGVLVALVTVLGLTLGRPALLYLALGGIVFLIPTFVVQDPKAYWLFLLVLSMPFEIHKKITSFMGQYGPSRTLSLNLYLTDAVLLLLLLFWVGRLCLRRENLYFPKIGYIFILYLAWALVVSLIEADSFSLSMIEWWREILYFLSFVYLVNNVLTRLQLRAIVFALFVAFVIASASVIAFFALGIGTETFAFSGLYGSNLVESTRPLILYEGISGAESHTKRSAGIFVHPAVAAFFLEFTLSIVLAYLTAAARYRDRILFGGLFALGCVALYLTFSRAGAAGFIAGSVVFFAVGRWSRLVTRRVFARCVFIFVVAAALAAPLLIASVEARPQTLYRRWELVQIILDAYWQRPILGAGLNNSTAAIKEGEEEGKSSHQRAPTESIHSHYLLVLTEVGLVGFLLFFAFFLHIVMIALRSMRAAETAMKLLLVGIVASFASIAIHILADGLGAHPTNAMLWLYAGLIVAIAGRVQPERIPPAAGRPDPVVH
jgi:O-antigen ligase